MNKSAEEAYQFGFQDELEKIAATRPGLVRRGLRRLFTGQVWRGSRRSGRWVKPLSAKAYQAKHAVPPTQEMFIPGITPTPRQLKRIDRKMMVADLRFERTRAEELPLFLRKGLGSKKYL